MGDGKDHIFTTNLCHVVTCTQSISPSIWRTFVELDGYNIDPTRVFSTRHKIEFNSTCSSLSWPFRVSFPSYQHFGQYVPGARSDFQSLGESLHPSSSVSAIIC